jgi:putative phosphoserine phosphatase / 1-acylglycerol-3-phosphate O-acyltransferase
VLPPIPTDDWTDGELDQRITEVRGRYLDTLADWPAR